MVLIVLFLGPEKEMALSFGESTLLISAKSSSFIKLLFLGPEIRRDWSSIILFPSGFYLGWTYSLTKVEKNFYGSIESFHSGRFKRGLFSSFFFDFGDLPIDDFAFYEII